MKRPDWVWGLIFGLGIGFLGLGLRGLGVGWPLEDLFAQVTFWLGVPAVFNLVHGLFGYGELGKNLAFVGTVGAWLLVHPFFFALMRGRPRLGAVAAALFYWFFGGWVLQNPLEGVWAALLYGGLMAGLGWLRSRRGRETVPATPELRTFHDHSKRESLKTLGLAALAVTAGATLWQQAKAQAAVAWGKVAGLSKELFGQADLYVVSKNVAFLDPRLKGKRWKLEVGGSVANPLAFNLDELKRLPPVELVNTLTCISNPVGGDLIGSVRWKGVPLKTVLDRAGVKSDAKFIVWEAADRFVESIPLAQVPPEALLAYAAHNPETGAFEELTEAHGYPLRILLPGRYGMKQPKWLTKITLSPSETTGYWAQRGWSRTAVIRTMSRIDTPKHRASLKAGQETFVAGVAYAGGRPLERVEVSADGGKTWREAELKPPKARFAWQQWALPWRPEPGGYDLRVRAVEVGGRVQEAKAAEPLPDGATGYHRVSVRVG